MSGVFVRLTPNIYACFRRHHHCHLAPLLLCGGTFGLSGRKQQHSAAAVGWMFVCGISETRESLHWNSWPSSPTPPSTVIQTTDMQCVFVCAFVYVNYYLPKQWPTSTVLFIQHEMSNVSCERLVVVSGWMNAMCLCVCAVRELLGQNGATIPTL